MPTWLRRWARADSGLVSVEDINADGILQLAELRLSGDVIVLAAPEMAGLPYFVTCLVAAGGLAAALSTADGLLLNIANSVSHDVYYRMINPKASAIRRVMLSKVMVLAVALFAAYMASLAPDGHPALRVGGVLVGRGMLLPGADPRASSGAMPTARVRSPACSRAWE